MNINELLIHCLHLHASDLHLSSGSCPYVRVEGELIPWAITIDSKEVNELIFSLLNEQQQKYFHEHFEIDFSYEIPEQLRCRVHLFQQRQGLSASIRMIPIKIKTLSELNLPLHLENICNFSSGLVLVTGATGSGKSSTLAALLDHINTSKSFHMVTLEDPIEFVHHNKQSLVHQKEIQQHTRCFNSALRAVLREDPNVILIGEMRDLETIRLTLTASETGHLVFSTLHTSSVPSTISRILDVFSSEERNTIRTMLAENLKAVICQKLIKKEGGGRIPLLEIGMINPAIKNLIREDKIPHIYSVIQTHSESGMQTFEQHYQKTKTPR